MQGRKKRERASLSGKTILLGVTGSIAAYKACELVRRLKDEGADVYCLMSAGAQKFVTPLTLKALSGRPVAVQIWDDSIWEMAHLSLAKKADLILIAPASASAMARLAAGLADEIISAVVCAASSPVLIAPAMHAGMWLHPATQANVRRLKSYGYRFIGPETGALASGDHGPGRFAETGRILAEVKKALS